MSKIENQESSVILKCKSCDCVFMRDVKLPIIPLGYSDGLIGKCTNCIFNRKHNCINETATLSYQEEQAGSKVHTCKPIIMQIKKGKRRK